MYFVFPYWLLMYCLVRTATNPKPQDFKLKSWRNSSPIQSSMISTFQMHGRSSDDTKPFHISFVLGNMVDDVCNCTILNID